jgi:hypothetical protein
VVREWQQTAALAGPRRTSHASLMGIFILSVAFTLLDCRRTHPLIMLLS